MNLFAAVTLLVVYVSALVPWVYVLLHHWLTRGAWRRDPLGRHIIALTAVDGAIFTMLLAATWWPLIAVTSWYRWVYLAAVAGIPAVTIWRGVILWRLYHPTAGEPAPRPTRLMPRLRWPVSVWQVVLGAAQVVNGVAIGSAGWRVTLLLGAAQLAVACFAYGRTSTTSPATSP